jgi:hypothetical protein
MFDQDEYKLGYLTEQTYGGMRKRKASGPQLPAAKYRRGGGTKVRQRIGYKTVPRTRGVYGAGEMKYFDTQYGAIIPAANDWTGTEADPATFNCLVVPVVGAAINQRIGREIKVYRIKLRGYVHLPKQANQTATDDACAVRLTMYLDKQTNATQAQGEQLFHAATTGGGVNSFQNTANFGRFWVLKDKMLRFDGPNMSYDGTNMEQSGAIRHFKMNCILKAPISVRFNATNGGSIADIVDNSFHMLANSSNVDLVPTLYYCCRVCYKES